MGGREKEGGERTSTRRRRLRDARASGRRARSGARQGGEGGKGEREEREGEIRGGRTRRVTLGGKWTGRALKQVSGCSGEFLGLVIRV